MALYAGGRAAASMHAKPHPAAPGPAPSRSPAASCSGPLPPMNTDDSGDSMAATVIIWASVDGVVGGGVGG